MLKAWGFSGRATGQLRQPLRDRRIDPFSAAGNKEGRAYAPTLSSVIGSSRTRFPVA